MSGALTRYDAARTAVAECRSIDEAKDIADKALALAAYARQAHDNEMERWVAEIRLRARRRMGEISAGLEKAAGRPEKSDGENLSQRCDKLPGKREVLKAAGVSKDEAHRCELIARVPQEAFEAYIAEKAALGQAVTADEVVRKVKLRSPGAGRRRAEAGQ